MAKPPQKRSSRPAPAKLPTATVKIEKLNEDGLGITHLAGKEAIVFGGYPGETLEVGIEHEGQWRIVARPFKILTKSPQRRPSPCKKVAHCRGCPLLQLKPAAQLQFKQQRVKSALAQQAGLGGITVPEVLAAPQPLGYRTSAKLVIGKINRQAVIGLYRRGTHDIVDIGDCPLHHPLINRISQVVRDEIVRQNLSTYDPRRQQGLLRYLLVRVSPSQNKAMVTFVTRDKEYRQVTHLAKWLQRQVPEVVSVHQNVNPTSGNVIFGRDTLKMLGHPDLVDQVGEVRLRLAPGSFLQVNHDQAARIYALVREWSELSREDTAVDIYCGIGGIALHLAKHAGRVIGIEVVEEAIRNARDNAALNQLGNCSFYAGDAAEQLDELQDQIPPGSVIVLNPPRSGCDSAVLDSVVALRPRVLIYVSCNPETLARDLALLKPAGYKVDRLQPVDMFPQTPHVETVVRLVPVKGLAGKKRP
jgi:23S rRNA (uracil1939-C5)-methyltransferase